MSDGLDSLNILTKSKDVRGKKAFILITTDTHAKYEWRFGRFLYFRRRCQLFVSV